MSGVSGARKKARRSQEIADELAPALQLMVGNLRIGRDVLSSFSEVADTVNGPLHGIFADVLAETRLGAPLGEVLQRAADAEQERHLAIVASAFSLHSRHGGSLVEIMEAVIETIEEEDKVRRDVRSITADGRLSAIVLLAMPPVVLLFVSALNPGYAAPLVTDPLGRMFSVIGAVLGFTGWRWLRRLGNPRVVL